MTPGFLARVGGVLIAPRATFAALVDAPEGRGLNDALALLGLRVLAGEVLTLAKAVARARLLGLGAALPTVLVAVGQALPDLVGIFVAGALLSLFSGARARRPPSQAKAGSSALDLAAWCWIPYLTVRVLVGWGAILVGRVPVGPVAALLDGVAVGWAVVVWTLALLARRARLEGSGPVSAGSGAAAS